jgi:NAD(P)H-hydrate repair Nnr-like enzyme with NAD(P)H-hydrate epimerase domain
MSKPSIFEQAATSTEPLELTIRPLMLAAEEPNVPTAMRQIALDDRRVVTCGDGANGGGSALPDNWWRRSRSFTILGIAPSCRCG